MPSLAMNAPNRLVICTADSSGSRTLDCRGVESSMRDTIFDGAGKSPIALHCPADVGLARAEANRCRRHHLSGGAVLDRTSFNRGPDRRHYAVNGAPPALWHARSIPPVYRAAPQVPLLLTGR